jgi:hypothetical protein
MVFTINSNIIENLSNVKMDVVDNSTRFAIIENNNTGGIITNIENETKNVNEKIEYFNKYGFIKIRINRNKLNQFIDKLLNDLSLENRQKIKNRVNADKLIPLIHNNSGQNIHLINKNNLDEIIIPKVLITNDIENYLKLTTLDVVPTGKIGDFKIKIENLLKNSDTTTLILICDLILKSFVSFFTYFDSQILNHNISNLKFLEIAGDQLITLLSKNNCLKIKEDSFIEYDNELCNIPKTESNCPVCHELCPTCPVCPVCPSEDKPNYLWQILSVIFIIIIFLLVIMLMSNRSRVNNLIRTINRLRYES